MTEMYGPRLDEGELMSSLPTLETMFKPEMLLKSITAFQDPLDNGLLTGL